MEDADYWIRKLELAEHPEGGYFKETYRAREAISGDSLPDRFRQARPFSTSVYYLLKGDQFSYLHRLKSDELWHFYAGSSLAIHVIDQEGKYSTHRLGSDFEAGEVFQVAVMAGCWSGATVDDPASYSLVGCTVAPGFDFDDLELADREMLVRLYPEHHSITEKLTRTPKTDSDEP